MNKQIVEYLTEIGQELSEEGQVNDEKLARLIWKRALGYVETREDGSETHYFPDPKAQQFIIERREGKAADVEMDNGTPTLVEKISETIVAQINKRSEQLVRTESETRTEDAVPS